MSLDPLSLSDDIDINQTDVKVVPTQGAIVQANFITRKGGRAVMKLSLQNGKTPPFGSLVIISGQDGNAGIVGRNGLVYLTGLPDKGRLLVKWNNGECHVQYALTSHFTSAGLYNIMEECR